MMNISNLFFEAAKVHPDKIAIATNKESITFRALAESVEQTATYLKEKGIGQGDRVLVFVPMSIDLYRIVLALFSRGATAVFLDEWVSMKRLELCCELANCQGFVGIFKARLVGLFSKAIRKIPIKFKVGKRSGERTPSLLVDDDTPALITFTTGSTGTPKAAVRSHAFLKAQFDALMQKLDPNTSDVDMPVLPIVLFMNLGLGCTSVVAPFNQKKPQKNDFDAIVELIQRAKVNRITASPFFIKSLAEHCLPKKETLPQLDKIFTGGAPVFPQEAQLYTEAFPTTASKIVYGSTEAEPISSIMAQELVNAVSSSNNGLCVGEVFHETALHIFPITIEDVVLQEGESVPQMSLPDGEIGEIVVSGNHVLKRYYNNPKAFASNKIVEGDTVWHRTGDSGYLENGKLYLLGRCQQLIATETGYISPFVVENLLQTIDGVDMGTILLKQGKLVLAVALHSTTTERAFTKDQALSLLSFDEVQVIKEMPRDPRHHSKIDYGRLAEILA